MSNVIFIVQPQEMDAQPVNVVRRWRPIVPWFYALVARRDQETSGRRVVRVHIEFQCVFKHDFDRMDGPPFPAMSGLARTLSMRNFTLTVSPALLQTINGVITGDDEDVEMGELGGQPAQFHQGNWVELLFNSEEGLPIVLRTPRHDNPALLDLDYDERFTRVRTVRRVRPPRNLIRLKRFVE